MPPRVLQLSRHDPLGQPMAARAGRRSSPRQPPRAHGGLYAPASGPLEGVVVRENMVVSRPAPGSKNSDQHPVVRGPELVVVYLKQGPRRALVEKTFEHLGFHHSDLKVQKACLPAAVELLPTPAVKAQSIPRESIGQMYIYICIVITSMVGGNASTGYWQFQPAHFIPKVGVGKERRTLR